MKLPESAAELHAALLEIYIVSAQNRHGLVKINQLMHAVQAGARARALGLAAPQVVAALLHDIGHMLHPHEHAPLPLAGGAERDCRHEARGAAWLARYFGPAVTEPVRLHVAAKRYLCAVEPGYLDTLAPEALASLLRQGGPMHRAEQQAFAQEAYFRQALQLRRIDDAAKDPDGPMPLLGSFWMDIEACTLYAACAH